MAYSSSMFTYCKAESAMVAEASDLGLRGWPRIIQIRSERTGRVISALQVGHDVDGEGELQAVNYQPIADHNGPVNLARVTLFND